MTNLELARELGVNKEKIKYLQRQLPEHMYVMVNGKVILSDAAVDAIKNKLAGGELSSDIPVPEYDDDTRIGWGKAPESGEFIGEQNNDSGESQQNANFTAETSDEIGEKAGNGEVVNSGEVLLTFLDHYKELTNNLQAQLSAKDEQIKALTDALVGKNAAASDATERQLAVKDAQIERMQDTIDELTRQLEQSKAEPEPPRRWWQWWKR